MLAVTLTPVSAQLAGGGNAKAAPEAAKGGKGGKGKGGKGKNAGPTERIGTVAINQPDFGGPGMWNVPYITNMSNSITAGGLEKCEDFPIGSGGTTPSCAPFTPLGREVFAGRRKTDSATDPEGFCPPGGETHFELRRRSAAILAEIIASGTRTVVVSHGVSGAVMRGLHLGLDARSMFVLEQPQDAFFRLLDGREERILAVLETA